MLFYENCRIFLEELIRKEPNNHELLKIYDNLIDKYTEAEKKRIKAEYKSIQGCEEKQRNDD